MFTVKVLASTVNVVPFPVSEPVVNCTSVCELPSAFSKLKVGVPDKFCKLAVIGIS